MCGDLLPGIPSPINHTSILASCHSRLHGHLDVGTGEAAAGCWKVLPQGRTSHCKQEGAIIPTIPEVNILS